MNEVLLICESRGFGGAEVYLERLVRNLRGWRPRLLVPDRRELRGWRDRLRNLGVPAKAYPAGIAGVGRLIQEARRPGVGLVHVNLPSTYDGWSGLLPWLVQVGSGKPLVATEHLTRIPRSRRRRWLKLRTAERVCLTIAVSRASGDALAGEGRDRERIRVVPNGVPDPGPPSALPPERPLRVGVLAALEPRKQLEVLVQAWSRLPQVDLELSLGGTGSIRPALQRLIERLGQSGRIRMTGEVADPYAFFSRHHVSALPSRLEGMPLSVLESFAAGRGVLASAIPGMDEIVTDGENGRLLPPGDVTAWTEALARAAAAPDSVRSWGTASRRRYLERFTLAAWVEATERVYREAEAERA